MLFFLQLQSVETWIHLEMGEYFSQGMLLVLLQRISAMMDLS